MEFVSILRLKKKLKTINLLPTNAPILELESIFRYEVPQNIEIFVCGSNILLLRSVKAIIAFYFGQMFW